MVVFSAVKIIFLNCFEGCLEPERFDRLVDWVNSENPDILGLSELNNWDKNDFKKINEFKAKTSFLFHLFCVSSHGYHLGLFSRKIFLNGVSLSEGFKTGFICATQKGEGGEEITFAVTHLHSKNERMQLDELKKIAPYLDPSKNVILMGDMNALSKKDRYDEADLLRVFNKIKLEKFGINQVEFKVTDQLKNHGFLDIHHEMNRSFQSTVPTKMNKDEAHSLPLRLDYFFISPGLKERVKSYQIITNGVNDFISDHYPIKIELNEP